MWDKLLKILVKEKLSGNSTSFFALTKYKLLIYLLSSLLPCFIVILVLVIVLLGPVLMARQYFEDKKTDQPLLFEKEGDVLSLYGWCDENDENCDRGSEQKYYEQLNKTYEKYKNNGVELDTDLITGTIFYGNTITDDKFEGEDISDSSDLTDDDKLHLSDINNLASNMVSGNRIDYKKYREYLINTYIPKRFKSYYEDDAGKEQIADEIMGFASSNQELYAEKGTSYISSICKEVCVEGDDCYPLEDYVAGTVEAESGVFKTEIPNNYQEQWKAQSVVARTYVLYKTDWGKKPIPNNTNYQKFLKDGPLHSEILEVISETEGEVLTYDDEIIASEYDSFYMGNNFHCDDKLCYSTYEKKGLESSINNQKHEIVAYAKWKDKFQNGHGRGMSQFGAAYLADIGWDYKEILEYYYDDNVELSFMGNTFKSGEFMDGLLFPLGVNSKNGECVSAGNYYPSGSYHGAVDIGGFNMGYTKPYEEIPVIASIGGKITSISTNQWCSNSIYSNDDKRLPVISGCEGNNVTITVTDAESPYYNYRFIYYHLDSVASNLKLGDEVSSGQFLGFMGSTGNSTGYHLHFDIRTPSNIHLNSSPVPDKVTEMIRAYCKNNIEG